jgi:hypothetical protein
LAAAIGASKAKLVTAVKSREKSDTDQKVANDLNSDSLSSNDEVRE